MMKALRAATVAAVVVGAAASAGAMAETSLETAQADWIALKSALGHFEQSVTAVVLQLQKDKAEADGQKAEVMRWLVEAERLCGSACVHTTPTPQAAVVK